MPYNFSGFPKQNTAKGDVVSDGEIFTVGTGPIFSGTASGTVVTTYTGAAVVSTLSSYSAFASNPVRTATGIWQVNMKDSAFKVLLIDVNPISTGQASGLSPLWVQTEPTTTSSSGGLVINWVFVNQNGVPTEIPIGGQFNVYVVYNERSF
jgi:hypothetical protein